MSIEVLSAIKIQSISSYEKYTNHFYRTIFCDRK
jgi:hypothetical protein